MSTYHLLLGIGHQQDDYRQERTLVKRHWEFVGNEQRKSQLLNAGRYSWSFELMLPGDLPPSLECDLGSISYVLKATVARSAFIQNTVKKAKIKILRSVLPSEFELAQSFYISNTWAERMVYDISIPSKTYAFNDKIPITFKILPIDSELRVYALMASIKEYCTYTAHDNTKAETRIVRLIRHDKPFPEPISSAAPTWEMTLNLEVPSRSPLVYADAESDMIRIKHQIKFAICFANAEGQTSELRCSASIMIVESFAPAQELTSLPAYNEMWRSIPYDPLVEERLRVSILNETACSRLLSVTRSDTIPEHSVAPELHTHPVAIPGSNHTSRQHSRRPSIEDQNLDYINPLETEQLPWWDGIDLGKVPSYSSVATHLFPSSLPPNYDSVTDHADNNASMSR